MLGLVVSAQLVQVPLGLPAPGVGHQALSEAPLWRISFQPILVAFRGGYRAGTTLFFFTRGIQGSEG